MPCNKVKISFKKFLSYYKTKKLFLNHYSKLPLLLVYRNVYFLIVAHNLQVVMLLQNIHHEYMNPLIGEFQELEVTEHSGLM